jgi:hypothetical protein
MSSWRYRFNILEKKTTASYITYIGSKVSELKRMLDWPRRDHILAAAAEPSCMAAEVMDHL